MSSDLLIINEEQFVGEADVRSSVKADKVKKSPASRSEEGPRKRAKRSLEAIVKEVEEEKGEEEEEEGDQEGDDDDAGPDEQSKRARGRPRLDTKDQSAADRRRTQIRLAQRAYRSRKENAIQTLENEVKVLQETNEEMSAAFLKLHNFAVSQGILERAPAFAQELQSTTEKILMLAEKSSESGPESSRAASNRNDAGPSKRSSEKQPEKSIFSEAVEAPTPTMGNPIWGYTFDNQTQMNPAPDVSGVSQPPESQFAITQAPLDYENITMPTLDNASFLFDPTARGSFFAQGAMRSVQDQNVTPNITPPAFSPSASLPMPQTMAYVEATFGRRLQRSTMEFACRLSTTPNPPNDRFAKVFGFCLLFESIEQIRTRLHKGLEKTRQESLNNWRVPFWALGGIGEHQVGVQQPDRPVGNQGTADVAKHAFGTNFAMGPFDAGTTEARDRQLDTTMRIMLPGFQGDFFDPDEVELYLQSRGVCIQPGQDYVTAEVDMAWLEDLQQQQSSDLYSQWVAGMPPPVNKIPETTTMAAVDGSWMSQRGHADTQAATNVLGLAKDGKSSLVNRKCVVTLNVDVLIRELILHGVCLGRTPAFREVDVNKAFWTATRGLSGLDF
ncbi:hypothetical protein N0V93_002723 [Gnomoniopsis smithogilvyi]|uniref:BZIP domain-containing protein n=1 Tax=Gnomoniopsis smithogilvyi TaxID=1191159 RepID=A0A9W8YXA2_9PEZI|nr:hypothetical protein N0V93_002723 [Gnomoniopsis smithogilvyi]